MEEAGTGRKARVDGEGKGPTDGADRVRTEYVDAPERDRALDEGKTGTDTAPERIRACGVDEGDLIRRALEARTRSYSPYSGFAVGAALLCADGRVFTGCNIENAAYGPSNCAERTAFFSAVAQGARGFVAIAVVGGAAAAEVLQTCTPCGVCLQVMREFCDPDRFVVIAGRGPGEYDAFLLRDLLPHGFGPENLGRG